MIKLTSKLTACAIAATAFLTACGGGGTTPDTTAPTVTIADNVTAATMTSGDVTFTFTFSEAVTGFAATDVTVTNGAKGAFTMAPDGLSATLLVTPNANSSGNVQVSVAADAFADVANNKNTAAASATQAFNTSTTPAPAEANLATFDGSSPTITPFGGAEAVIATAPSGGSGNALKVTRNGGEVWAGAWLPVPTIPSNAGSQIISARVYSPTAGIPIVAKAEFGDNTGTGDVAATETVVVGWQTLTWRLPTLDATKTYNRFVVLPQLGTRGTGEIYYFDDVSVAAASGGTGGTGGTGLVTFSSGFSSAVLTASGGLVATSGGSNLDDWGGAPVNGWSGSFADGAGGVGANSYAGFYYQTPTAPAGLYSQMEVFGPNVNGFNNSGDTSGVTINGQTKVNFTFNQNPEWFNSANNKFAVVITLGKRYAIGTGCRIQLHGVKTPTAVTATAYSMNLVNDFRVAQDCGTGIAPDAVAQALTASPVVSSVKVLGAGGGAAIIGRNNVQSGANLSTVVSGVYPTTVVLKGAITFD